MRIRKRTWTTARGEKKTAYVADLGLDPVTGKRRRKQFPTRAAAKKWVDNRPADKKPADKGTVREAAANWLDRVKADGRQRRTWKEYDRCLRRHAFPIEAETKASEPDSAKPFGDWAIAEIDAPAMLRFKTAMQKSGRTPATVQRIMGRIRMMFNDAVNSGTIPANPAATVRSKQGERHRRPVEIPEPSQVRQLLRAVNRGSNVTLGQVIVNLLPATGLRPEEMRAMPEALVQVDRRPYQIEVAWAADDQCVIGPPKSKAGYRKIPVPDGLAVLLRAWRKVRPKTNHQVVGQLAFPTSGGHVYYASNLYHDIWRPLMKALGFVKLTGGKDKDGKPKWLPAFTLYSLRHFYASMLIAQGVREKELQKKMGHASVQMTMDIYGHLFEDADREQQIADKVGRFLAG